MEKKASWLRSGAEASRRQRRSQGGAGHRASEGHLPSLGLRRNGGWCGSWGAEGCVSYGDGSGPGLGHSWECKMHRGDPM